MINAINQAAGKPPIKGNTSKMAFKQMENIGKFLQGCEDLGLNKIDLFQTVALYEGTNIPQVVDGIHALGRRVSHWNYQLCFILLYTVSITWSSFTSTRAKGITTK